jgi:hypothetical protein
MASAGKVPRQAARATQPVIFKASIEYSKLKPLG